MEHIGRQLARARADSRVTQAELAARLGVRQSRVSQLEHQANPRMQSVQSYTRALGFELILIPRRHQSQVRALIESGAKASFEQPDSGSLFPTLAEITAEAPERATRRTRARMSTDQ